MWRNPLARRRDEPFNPFTAGSSPRGRGRDFNKKRQAAEEAEPVETVVDRKTLQEAMIAKVLAATEEESPAKTVQVVVADDEEIPPTIPEVQEETQVPSESVSDSVTASEPEVVEPAVEPGAGISEKPDSKAGPEAVSKTEKKSIAKPLPKPASKPAPEAVVKPAAASSPKPETAVKALDSTSSLEDLKRRSTELAVKTGHEPAAAPAAPASATPATTAPAAPVPVPGGPVGIVRTSPKPKQRRRYRKTKTGGGRQPKQAKLDRRKQLEFRFDIRRILEDSTVAEEHRSNLLGQVWAKGERIGIDAANEYIEQKHHEGIIDDGIVEELHRLVRSYTTKR